MGRDEPFIIRPTPAAREAFDALDSGLREELLQHAAELSEDPVGRLVRGTHVEGEEVFVYRYRSGLVSGLRVSLLLAREDLALRTAVLIAIGTLYE
jgi:hypothetical protein